MKDVRLADGSIMSCRIRAVDGTIGLDELDQRGEAIFLPLRRTRTYRRPTSTGYCWTNEYEIPKEFGGGGKLYVRVDKVDGDPTEMVRPRYVSVIPATDPDFKLFGRREDAETINGILKSLIYLRRAHSLGVLRQHVDMIGFALGINSLALFLAGRRAPPGSVAD